MKPSLSSARTRTTPTAVDDISGRRQNDQYQDLPDTGIINTTRIVAPPQARSIPSHITKRGSFHQTSQRHNSQHSHESIITITSSWALMQVLEELLHENRTKHASRIIRIVGHFASPYYTWPSLATTAIVAYYSLTTEIVSLMACYQLPAAFPQHRNSHTTVHRQDGGGA